MARESIARMVFVSNSIPFPRKGINWGIWLAQSVEHATLDLRVVSLSPTLGMEIT